MADTRRRRIPVWLELVLLLVLLALAAWGLRVGYIRYMRSAYPVEYEAYVEAYAEEYGGWSGFYSSLEDRQQNLSAVLGDAVFTRSGDRCTAQPSVKSLLGGEEDDMVGVSGSYTLNTATGAASGDLTLDIKGSLFPVANRTRLTFDLSGTSGRMTLSNHLRNQGTLTFDLSLSLAPSSAPVSAPPKNAVLTPLDELNGISDQTKWRN